MRRHVRRHLRLLDWIICEILYAGQSAGYWIRPYDMIADRRRWRWQRRAKCGSQLIAELPRRRGKTADALRALVAAANRAYESRTGKAS